MSVNDNTAPKRTGKRRARICPVCGKPSDERYDPFCSKRCADVDLHRWLKGGYIIPGADSSPSSDIDED